MDNEQAIGSIPHAAGAMEALERMLGETWDRDLWLDACHRAGVTAPGAPTCEDLRRIAREICEVPGPATRIGQALYRHIAICERAQAAEAA